MGEESAIDTQERIQERLGLLRVAIARPLPRVFLIIFAAIGVYDTVVAQFLPKDMGDSAPNIFEIAHDLALWVADWPWWIWVLGLFTTAFLSVLEFAVRQTRKYQVSEASRKALVRDGGKPGRRDYTVAELSTFSSFFAPDNMASFEDKTFVSFLLDGSLYAFIDSHNVNSIDDDGAGELTINFAEDLSEDYFVKVTSDGSARWEITDRSPGSCRIKFHGEEPSRIKLEFEEN